MLRSKVAGVLKSLVCLLSGYILFYVVNTLVIYGYTMDKE